MELTSEGLPVIDLSEQQPKEVIAEHIANACKTGGCFYVKNHGVDDAVLQRTFADLRTFFAQPAEYKAQFVNSSGNYERGYNPFATSNVNAFMGNFGLPNDAVEKFAFGPPDGFVRPVPANIWPDVPGSLQTTVQEYFGQVTKLAEQLMRLFSIAARAPSENFFLQHCKEGEHSLKANFYRRGVSREANEGTRFGEHTDSTPITILSMDQTKKALQVVNAAGEWVYANPVPNTMFVNVGDFMAIWTNDKWKATVHRVLWPEFGDGEPEDGRLSLAFFVLLNPGAVAECLESCIDEGENPKYAPTNYVDYLNARMTRYTGKKPHY